MEQRVYEALLKLVDGDEDEAKRLAEQIDGTNAVIADNRIARTVPVEDSAAPAGAESVERTEEQAETASAEEPVVEAAPIEAPPAAPQTQEVLIDDDLVSRIADTVAERVGATLLDISERMNALSTEHTAAMEDVNKRLDELVSRLQAVETSEEERLKEAVADMPAQRVHVSFRPRAVESPSGEEPVEAIVNKTLAGLRGHELWPA